MESSRSPTSRLLVPRCVLARIAGQCPRDQTRTLHCLCPSALLPLRKILGNHLALCPRLHALICSAGARCRNDLPKIHQCGKGSYSFILLLLLSLFHNCTCIHSCLTRFVSRPLAESTPALDCRTPIDVRGMVTMPRCEFPSSLSFPSFSPRSFSQEIASGADPLRARSQRGVPAPHGRRAAATAVSRSVNSALPLRSHFCCLFAQFAGPRRLREPRRHQGRDQVPFSGT